MAGLIEIVKTLILGAVLSTTWLCIAVLARLDTAIFLPQAVRFFSAALVLLVLGWITTRRLPQISLRLFHASITVAALAHVLSPVLCFFALRALPSGLGSLMYVSIPIWFLLAAYGEGGDRLWQHVFIVVGLLLVTWGVWEQADLRGGGFLSTIALVVGMIAFMAGVWVSRRLFWLHAAMDLNFWSMLFAGVTHSLLALTANEYALIPRWTRSYWSLLLFFSFIVTGLGAHFYRVRKGNVSSLILTIVTPGLALLLSFFAWQETPINFQTVTGAILVLGVLFWNAWITAPNRWLVLYLNNDKRQGDRLVCLLIGEVTTSEAKTVKIQITDISIGGLGFRAAEGLKIGETVLVTLPIAQQGNNLTLTCQVARLGPNSSRDFPIVGGLSFKNVSEARWQNLVEFLARLAKAEEE